MRIIIFCSIFLFALRHSFQLTIIGVNKKSDFIFFFNNKFAKQKKIKIINCKHQQIQKELKIILAQISIMYDDIQHKKN